MSFRLSEPTLIEGRREWGAFLLLCALIFALSISFRYYNYLQFSSQKRLFADADVLIQYTKRKGGREYEVLKLTSSDGLTFYTTSKEPIKDLRGRNITLLLFPKRVSFYDYLKTPYIPSAIARVNHERSSRMALAKMLESMHEDRRLQELFGALFFALPISKDLRDSVTLLGINHLLALSGFHMGLLWLFVYGGLSLLYTPFQNRLFPWRHRLLDVGLLTVIVLGAYLLFTGMPPSLLRAFAMLLIGWMALLWGVELLSFSFLAFCTALLVALFPQLLFSVGFWLSVSGVFFIYQFLKIGESRPKWIVALLINIWLFLAMLPLVHSLFGTFSIYQILSIPLTLLFSIFYPLAMLLHLTPYADLFDTGLAALLQLPADGKSVEVVTPIWLLAIYLLLCVASLRLRAALYLQTGFMLLFFLYLVKQVA